MKTNLEILENKKWVNAAGTAGFAPSTNLIHRFPDLGLFITNPISYLPRSPSKERKLILHERNFLVHNGFPCPGYKSVIKKYQKVWETSDLPICVSLLSDHSSIIEKIVRSVEILDNIVAIEIMLDQNSSFDEMKEILKAAVGELPIIISIPFEWVYGVRFDQNELKDVVALSLQPPRGTLIRNKKTTSGRLYGPGMLPLTLRAISHIISTGKPIIAGVGAYSTEDIQNIYDIGANNFQVNELMWREYS